MISVIVPIFNSERTLSRCLDSILSQSYKDIEVLCVNDGSTDSSEQLIKHYSVHEPRVKLLNKVNGGLSSARNFGLDNASGSYICFIDSDDFISPNMFETMLNVMLVDDVDLVGCGTQVHYEAWQTFKESDDNYYSVKLGRKVLVEEGIFKKFDVSAWNKLFKRSIIERYSIRFPDGLWYEDAPFIWSYVVMAQKVSFIDNKFYNYIRYSSSIMGMTYSRQTTKVLDHIRITNIVVKFLSKHGKVAYFWNDLIDFTMHNFWFSYNYLPQTKKYLSYIELLKTILRFDISNGAFPTLKNVIFQRNSLNFFLILFKKFCRKLFSRLSLFPSRLNSYLKGFKIK